MNVTVVNLTPISNYYLKLNSN